MDTKGIKAIMCDVDGTLLNSEGVVSLKTVTAIKKVREKGILFGLSTGRDVNSIQKLLSSWNLEGLVDTIVGTGGAEICDFIKGVKKSSYPLDGSYIKEIMAHFEDMDVNFAIPDEGIFYTFKEDRHIQMLSIGDKVPYQVVDKEIFLKKPRAKLIIICDKEYMDQVILRSKTFANDTYKAASLKTASELFEYMDARISKSRGLQEVMALHGLTLDNVCTFGDADNDYDMTLNAKIGVVMENGSELTKSVADYITDDHDHDGIGNFINTYFL